MSPDSRSDDFTYWWGRLLDAAYYYSNNRALYDDDSAEVYKTALDLYEHHKKMVAQVKLHKGGTS